AATQNAGEADTVYVDLTMEMEVAGMDLTVKGTSGYDLKNGNYFAETKMFGQKTEMRVVDGVLYVRMPLDEMWYVMEDDLDMAGAMGLGFLDAEDPLEILEHLGASADQAVRDGTENIRGEKATRYVATVPIPDFSGTPGLTGLGEPTIE